MKINLSIEKNSLQGYINICPFITEQDSGITKDRIDNIDKYVDDGEAEEIRIVDAIQYFAGIDTEILFHNWIKKLKHGGKLIVVTTDLMQVCRAIANYNLDIDTANTLLYGQQKEQWQFYRAGFTMSQLVDYLQSRGLKITKKRILDYKCVVEAIRP